MLLTEEEARKKWCPHARPVRETDRGEFAVGNRVALTNVSWLGDNNPESCRCIASECMAWRWVGYRADDGSDYPTRTVGDIANAKGMGLPRTGYCGLADKP